MPARSPRQNGAYASGRIRRSGHSPDAGLNGMGPGLNRNEGAKLDLRVGLFVKADIELLKSVASRIANPAESEIISRRSLTVLAAQP